MELPNDFIQYVALINSMSVEFLADKISREAYLQNLERMLTSMKKLKPVEPKEKK